MTANELQLFTKNNSFLWHTSTLAPQFYKHVSSFNNRAGNVGNCYFSLHANLLRGQNKLRNKSLTLASVLFTKSVAGRQLWGHTETVSSGRDGQLSLQVFVV